MSSTGESDVVSLEERVFQALRLSGTDRERTVLVAVSGGADSCALLCAACSTLSDTTLVVAHYNHSLRASEKHEAEMTHVVKLARRFGQKVNIGSAGEGEVESQALRSGSGVEAAARELRYHFLRSVAENIGARTILTAHTADDQIETILMGLIADHALIGLAGIPGKRELSATLNIVRPMLSVSRLEVEAYLKSRDIPWMVDESNSDPRFFRNRVRHTVIPALSAAWPELRAVLRGIATDAQIVRTAANTEADRLCWHGIDGDTGTYVLDACDFWGATPSARLVSLWRLAAKSGIVRPDSRPPVRFFQPLLGDSPGGAKKLVSGRGITIEHRGDQLIWSSAVVRAHDCGYFLVVETDTPVRLPTGQLVMLRRSHGDDATGTPSVVHLPSLAAPVTIRSQRPGDMIATSTGDRLIADLLRDHGVSRDLRGSIPIVADRIGIAAIVGSVAGVADVVDTYSGERNQREAMELVIDGAE